MQTLLSPHSHTGLAFQPQVVFLLEEAAEPRILSAAEVSAWLSAHEELYRHDADTLAEVNRALSLQSARHEALDLALICLDGELSEELRDEAQQELEALLANPAVAVWLDNLFHVRPLAAGAEVEFALQTARAAQRRRLPGWLEPVANRQPIIAESWAAWSAIPGKLLQEAGGAQTVLEVGLEQGMFAAVVDSLAQGRVFEAKLGAWSRLQKVAGYGRIVEAWLGCFDEHEQTLAA